MTSPVREWLPDSALTGSLVQTTISALVANWSSRWFCQLPLAIERLHCADGLPTAINLEQERQFRGRIVVIQCSKTRLHQLVECALDMKESPPAWENSDRALIDAFADKMIADLLNEVEGALVKAEDHVPAWVYEQNGFRGNGIVYADLCDQRPRTLLTIALPRSAVIALCKEATDAPLRSPKKLTSRLNALSVVSVPIEVSLGTTTMSINDLRGVAIGDVVILDRSLKEGVDLIAAGSNRPFAKADLKPDNGHIVLQVK